MAEVDNIVRLDIRVFCARCNSSLAIGDRTRLENDYFEVRVYPCGSCAKAKVNSLFANAVSKVATEQGLEDS